MAIEWTDLVDGQSLILAEDINKLAHAIQDLEAAVAVLNASAITPEQTGANEE